MSGQGLQQDSVAGAALMDRIYGWQRPIYDLTRKYYLLGRDRLLSELAPPDGGTVLELGCGTARNLILAARRHPHARFFGIDLSSEMLAEARKAIAKAGLERRISVAQGDATRFDTLGLFGVATFDRVFLSYAVSMIPDWPRAIEAGAGALAGDGSRLSLVDFGRMEAYPGVFRAPLRAWLAAFHVSPRDGIETTLETTAEPLGGTVDCRSLFGGYAVYATLARVPARPKTASRSRSTTKDMRS
ncbi:class I SAM-dependent methyltransferase [Stappia stellulata]|uniref:class I SAM-dependent methyltransferase n=1 Tax=Stappia stellulata TaxID=71235 RepID=UPI00041FB9CC|nr:class I SAM-dependent methyltransferase [Stappia stellulata]